jgi:glycosyltransferase involved in cell wall biosynthesis
MDEIVFIYADGHKNTVYLADSLGIKIRKHLPPFFSRSIKNTILSMFMIFSLPKSKFYFIEGNFITIAIARKLHLIPKNAKIIKYLGEPIFYRLLNGQIKGLKKIFLDYFLKDVDAFVCHGDWQVELLSKYLPNAKKIMVYTPILSNQFIHITSNEKLPNLDSHNLLLIGNGRVKYKGIDMAIDALKIIREKYNDAKLNVIGKFDKAVIDRYSSVEGVRFLGFVPDLLSYIKDSALYVHPARGEAFGLSIVEAMLGGLPAIVSKDTGAKTFVEELGDMFVVDTNPKSVADSIDRYFSLKKEERIDLSNKAKNIASKLGPDNIIPKFYTDFTNLLKELN